MTDYAAFAADYDGDAASAFDEDAVEEPILGEAPALDDATWDAMLETAYDAPEASGEVDLLAEFAASITGIVNGFGDAMADLFDPAGDAEGEADPAEGVDLDGDGIPDDFDGDGVADSLQADAWEADDAASDADPFAADPAPADDAAFDL